jgi:uncharacterized protein YndB with AHSA1/START domain
MRALLILAVMALAAPAHAKVLSTSDSGFRIENRATIPATKAQAWTALGEIGRWWNSSHTYSGDANNMTIALKAGGCWCEAIPGGGVEHGRVVMVLPEKGTLRIDSATGPLQDEGVAGALTWQIKEIDGGVEVVQTYNVGGARPEIVKIAPMVDKVMGEQLERLKTYIAGR